MKRNQKGFAPVEVILVILVLVAVGFGGYYVWHTNHKPKATTSAASSATKKSSSIATNANILSLASGNVSFTLPSSWTYTKGSNQCLMFATADSTCIEGATITPGAKLPTRYGNGTEFFNIQVSIYQNPKQDDAKTFLETDMQEGVGTGNVKTSSDSVNGYNSFYLWQQYDGDGTSVREIDYSYSAKSMDVVIYARTYEPGTLDNGTKVGDFTQFESAIADMAKSIQIN